MTDLAGMYGAAKGDYVAFLEARVGALQEALEKARGEVAAVRGANTEQHERIESLEYGLDRARELACTMLAQAPTTLPLDGDAAIGSVISGPAR